MLWGCRKFVRTCSLFSARRFQHTLQPSRFEFNSSKLFGVVSFCVCAPFYRILCLLRVQDDCKVLFSSVLRGDSLLFPASICCNFCVSLSAKKEIARARNKLRLCVPQSRVKAERTKVRAQIETKRVE